RNTAFFAASVNNRWNRNKLLSNLDDFDVLVKGQAAVEGVAVAYFQNILGTPGPQFTGSSYLQDLIPFSVSAMHATSLIAPITSDEILTTLRSMKKNKSPGPDGYNVNFFLHCWSTVGDDFLKAVHSFFRNSKLPSGVNATSIALVPKVANPTRMADFRPISCCNTTYKCISKLLANRLKVVLPSLIGEYQSAFVAGRSISDNILIAQELFRNYHTNIGSPRCALKIDLRKAFDSVTWDFLFAAMYCF
ncbi:reverse transcriptase family protein, partial [Modestobacter lapidis]|nr:reverse transcriptase family protein [Modestobacter lapidis]